MGVDIDVEHLFGTLLDFGLAGAFEEHAFFGKFVFYAVEVGRVGEAVVGGAAGRVGFVVDAVPADEVVTVAGWGVADSEDQFATEGLDE
jgi:hypothetical protein